MSRGVQTCKCGADLRNGPRLVYFKKKIAGKRYHKGMGNITLREADRLYKEWEFSLRSSSPKKGPVTTLQQMFDAYLGKLRSEGKKYHKKVEHFFDRMMETWGDIPCAELNPAMIKRFQSDLRAAGLSQAYCDRHLAMLRAAWNYSLAEDLPNPVKRVKFYNPNNQVTEWLTADEEERLLKAAENPGQRAPKNFRIILTVALNTGLRLSNVLSLHTREVDFDRRTITVIQKRGRSHQVPMNTIVREALAEIRPQEPGYYFPSPYRKGQPLTRITATFKHCLEKAGINRPFRFHDLRHSFGTQLMRETHDLALVRSLMGHSDIKMTLRYTHVIDEDARSAVEMLANRRVNHGSTMEEIEK